MLSRDAFRVMADFAENEVSNSKIRNRLIQALNKSKPFRHFKYEVDYNEDVRQQWFAFKAQRYDEWVANYLEEWNDEDE